MAFVALLAVTGCGLGPGSQDGTAELLVTRDYGREVLVDETIDQLTESDTAMRLLDDSADVETRYGGGFVQSVDGLAGGIENGRSFDWFFAVNGVVAERGSADFPVGPDDKVWWDYRDWTAAMEVGAVIGSYPAPLAGGYDDRDWPVAIECFGSPACDLVEHQLEGDGVTLDPASGGGPGEMPADAMRVMVGTWDQISGTDEGRRLRKGPGASGVFATFPDDGTLSLHDVRGDAVRNVGQDAGLIAAMRRADDPPVWLITGGDDAGVKLAAAALNPEDLQHRYAAAVFDGQITSLPVP